MPSLDRQYKFRVDWEGNQFWTDPIIIIPHEVNEIDMDLDLLVLNLTGQHLYANHNHKKIQLAMVGLPYGLLVNSVIAAPSVIETIYYYHNDHLGTPQVVTDNQGQVVWKADYKPFGEVDIVVEDVVNNLRFPDQYYDGETGLHYNYFRDYHPGIGRYLTPYPIGLEWETNLFLYCQNAPVNRTDSGGLLSFGGGFGGFLGIVGGYFDISYTSCCEDGILHRYTILHYAYGLGVGLRIGPRVSPVTFMGSSSCPVEEGTKEYVCAAGAYYLGFSGCVPAENKIFDFSRGYWGVIAGIGGYIAEFIVTTKILRDVVGGCC